MTKACLAAKAILARTANYSKIRACVGFTSIALACVPAAVGQENPNRRWTGTVHWTVKHTPTHIVTSSATVKLRETRIFDGSIDLIHEGSVVTVTHSTLGGDSCTYAGQGTSPAEGRAGWFEREQNVGPNGETRWGAWTYELMIKPAREPIWTTTCPDVAWPGTDRTSTHSYGGNAGSTWQAAIGGLAGSASDDPEHDPQAPRLLDGGRMAGSYTTPGRYGRSVSWSICREGIACPPPPEAEEPCPEPPEKALLQTALAQQKLLMDRVGAKFDEYSGLAEEARQYQSDFELAIYTCNRISDLQVLLTLLVGQAPANIKKFTTYLGVIQNILQGNATFVIDDYVGESNALMAQWGKIMLILDRIVPTTAPPLRSQLLPCAGSNLDPVFDGAMNFVQLMEQIEPVMKQVNKLLNDQRSKDQEIFDLWAKYHPACLKYAKCVKLPASYCERLPSIDGWHVGGPPGTAASGPNSAPAGPAASSAVPGALPQAPPAPTPSAPSRGGASFMKP